MDLEKIISLGKQLGYKDADLQQFVTNERSRSDKRAQEDLEREERRIKREIERQQLEADREREKEQHEKEMLQLV